ncbi:MAG: SDR family NAD(P)-dependent oxidoreductase [Limisphaerales bacterium]
MAATSTETRRDVVLLTGATTGIGLALARLLAAEESFHLILTAREASLGRLAEAGFREGPHVWLRALDVTRDDQRRHVVAEAGRLLGGVDVLVNNAGVTFRSVLEHVNEREWLEQMRVNFRGPAELARLCLPWMRERRRGRILGVSSVGGMMAMPTMALYSASKFALEGAFEALWYEVRPWNIRVSLVQPGFVHSDGFTHTLYTAQARHGEQEVRDPYHAHYEQMAAFIARWMGRAPGTPESVARVIRRVMRMRRPPLRVPATPEAHLFGWLRRWAPRGLYHALLYRLLPEVRVWGK